MPRISAWFAFPSGQESDGQVFLQASHERDMGSEWSVALSMPVWSPGGAPGILAARAESAMAALGYIAIVLFGFQMWISNAAG